MLVYSGCSELTSLCMGTVRAQNREVAKGRTEEPGNNWPYSTAVVEGFGPVLACMSCEELNAGQDIDDNDVSFYILTIV